MAEFSVKADFAQVAARLAGLGSKTRWLRILRSLVAVFGFKDVVDHFRKEQGPDGRWPDLKPSYGKWKRKRGLTKKLVLTGQLRQSFLPSNIRDNDELSVALFNPVEYAGRHDEGKGVPQRQFMWLSNRATGLLEKGLADRIVGGAS